MVSQIDAVYKEVAHDCNEVKVSECKFDSLRQFEPKYRTHLFVFFNFANKNIFCDTMLTATDH